MSMTKTYLRNAARTEGRSPNAQVKDLIKALAALEKRVEKLEEANRESGRI
jgi:hypothetical protein